MSSGPKKIEMRGGARRGSGRKPKPPREHSEVFMKSLVHAAQRVQKKNGGLLLLEAILQLAYEEDTPPREKVAIAKLYCEHMNPRRSINSPPETEKDSGCAIYLPERKSDPAKLAPVINVKKEVVGA